MKTIKRDVPGHFCAADRCNFFLHTDIVDEKETDPFTNAKYCISLIGEFREGWTWLNASQKTYELMVFDKQSENPWTEIFAFFTNDKDEAIKVFKEKVKEYKNSPHFYPSQNLDM